ncbi:unnamed protein product, partial [Mesorhabditis spiculigera]
MSRISSTDRHQYPRVQMDEQLNNVENRDDEHQFIPGGGRCTIDTATDDDEKHDDNALTTAQPQVQNGLLTAERLRPSLSASQKPMRASAISMACRVSRVTPNNSVLFVCDLQEKFRQQIKYFPEILVTGKRLIDTARILNLRTFATEQYPKGLGHLVPELGLQAGGDVPIIEKSKFSMCIEPALPQLEGKENVILFGIEAHVCVLQTTLDLLERNMNVHVVVDATSSRTQENRKYAFKQMEKAGAVLTTSECVILGLLGGPDHPKFREVQKLIMESAPDTGLCKL